MPFCREDIRVGVAKKAMDELSDIFNIVRTSQYDFRVVSEKNQEPPKNRKDAMMLQRRAENFINSSFNGYITTELQDRGKFEPYNISLSINENYVNYLYSKNKDNTNNISFSPNNLANNEIVNNEERDFINFSTDWNNYEDVMNSYYPDNNIVDYPIGITKKYITFKKGLLNSYIAKLNKEKLKLGKKGLNKDELKNIHKDILKLEELISGNKIKGTIGLEQEIYQMENNKAKMVEPYAHKDLDKLSKLLESDSIDDINIARDIIEFYKTGGEFSRDIENPFFDVSEIFEMDLNSDTPTDKYILTDEEMQPFRDWAKKAEGYSNQVSKKKEELFISGANKNRGINTITNGEGLSFQDLVNSDMGLEDAHFIDMWINDPTVGMFSKNGYIPQIIFSKLSDSIEIYGKWDREIAEKIEDIIPRLHKALSNPILKSTLKYLGININGVSYNIFREKTKEGLLTNTLVNRFTREFNENSNTAISNFFDDLKIAKSEIDNRNRSKKFDKAFRNFKKWKINNTIIMEFNKLPEIVEMDEFEDLLGDKEVTDESYKKKLIDILGENGYKEAVEEQINLLRDYIAYKQANLETTLETNGVDKYEDLSSQAKSELSEWENNHNPIFGIEDYHNIVGRFVGSKFVFNYNTYNKLIPRKYEVNIKSDNRGNLTFTDINRETNYYSKQFELIEKDKDLLDFYNIAKEVTEKIRENLEPELQKKLGAFSLPMLREALSDIVADKDLGLLSKISTGFSNMLENFRLGFGVTKSGDISNATLKANQDGTSKNYKVNSTFLSQNANEISQRKIIERNKFLKAFNSNRNDKDKLDTITKKTILTLDSFNTEALLELANYLNIDISLADIKNNNLSAISSVLGNKIPIGRIISDFALHSVVQSQSFDLPKMLRTYANAAMLYAARKEVLPYVSLAKEYYNDIKAPETNNLGKPIWNKVSKVFHKSGDRDRANSQFESWFGTSLLGNYTNENTGNIETNNKPVSEDRIKKLNEQIKEIDSQIKNANNRDEIASLKKKKYSLYSRKVSDSFYDRNIYSKEDRQRLGELQELIEEETDEEKLQSLKYEQNKLGRVRTINKFFDNIYNHVRFLGLAYNLSGAVTNFVEGWISNMQLAANSELIDKGDMFYAYSIIKHSFLKNSTFGLIETNKAKKARKLSDLYDMLIDRSNELQKSTRKTLASRWNSLKPYQLINRVEYVNQLPVMISLLRKNKITDKDGNESSVWDAMTDEGKLKDNFRTEDNVKNWEELQGEEYLKFKEQLHTLIGLGHGFAYNNLRSIKGKSNSFVSPLLMFKTWLPTALFWRFAKEQPNLQLGEDNFKGRYLSYTKGSSFVHGALVGGITFGPVGALVGGLAGSVAAGFYGTSAATDVIGHLKETLLTTKELFLTALGMPVNLLAKRELIKSGKVFDKWVGKGEFTQKDANNLKSNLVDISIQLTILALILMVKGALYDDKDKDRKLHNILINKLMQLSSQASMYVNPSNLYKNTIQDVAPLSFLQNVGKELTSVEKYLSGEDIIDSGRNSGQSRLGLQTKRLILPGIVKDFGTDDWWMAGFQSLSKQQFQPTPFDNLFKSKDQKDLELNKSMRAGRRQELLKSKELQDELNSIKNSDEYKGLGTKEEKDELLEKATKHYINEILNDELPTPAKLKKLGETREEYNEQHKEQQNNSSNK